MTAIEDDLTPALTDGMLDVRGKAQRHALAAYARGHESERDWLDLLHLLDMAERDLVAVLAPIVAKHVAAGQEQALLDAADEAPAVPHVDQWLRDRAATYTTTKETS